MIRKISAVLMCVCLLACCFAGCSDDPQTAETAGGLADSVNDYGFEVDAEGNEVPVEYEDGKAYVLDADGNRTGEVIDNPKNYNSAQSSKEDKEDEEEDIEPGTGPEQVTDREDVSNNTGGSGTTAAELTTLPIDEDSVPGTSESGTSVTFSDRDVKIITNMLEVPYLYTESYESNQQVPISIATHVACWMLQRENLNTNNFASTTVVVDLFSYFARTVVSFKTSCNDYTDDGATNPAPIRYNGSRDTFTITADSYEEPTHRVNITEIQDLGNNNYYKVIADVEGLDSSCKATKLVAVIQKNRLDTSLGFSVKALKWS